MATATKGTSKAVQRVVLPGDAVALGEDDARAKRLRLGPGLRQGAAEEGRADAPAVVASKCGLLKYTKPAAYYVDSNQKRAVPVLDEQVIGVVTALGETHAVDIGAHLPATLSSLAFEGATKRNKPKLKIGDLVYARLTIANKDMEPEIECVDRSGKSSGMGPLAGGYMFTCSLGLCRKLLRSGCRVLQQLGEHFPFELAVGLNGRVWVDAKPLANTVLVANAIAASEHMTDAQVDALVKTMVAHAAAK